MTLLILLLINIKTFGLKGKEKCLVTFVVLLRTNILFIITQRILYQKMLLKDISALLKPESFLSVNSVLTNFISEILKTQ